MRNFLKAITVLTVCIMVSGCATIFSGSTQTITISSDPSDAKVKIYNKAGILISNSETPQTISLKRGRGFFCGETYRVVIEKDNYEKTELTVDSRFNGWYAGNVIFGGLLGLLIIDPATGAMWTLSPDMVSAELTKTLSEKNEMQLTIALKSSVPAKYLDKLQPINV